MTYIFAHNHSYTNLILSSLEKKGLAKIIFAQKPRGLKKFKYTLSKAIPFKKISYLKFSAPINEQLASINEDDTIILFDYLARHNVEYIISHTKAKTFHFWYWNTVTKNTAMCLDFRNRRDVKTFFHTFDPGDAKKYGMLLQNQFFNEDIIKNPTSSGNSVDFFFIGKDKGRLDKLIDLKRKLTDWGFSVRFIVLNKKLNYKAYHDLTIISKEIPYADVLQMIADSKVVVDLTKENQTGLTLRCLEGVFMGKKVVTDNVSVNKLPFFNANNFMALNEISKDKLEAFLESQTLYSPEDKRGYELTTWLDNVLKSCQKNE